MWFLSSYKWSPTSMPSGYYHAGIHIGRGYSPSRVTMIYPWEHYLFNSRVIGIDQGAEGVALVVKCLPILCGNLGLIASIAQARCGGAHL